MHPLHDSVAKQLADKIKSGDAPSAVVGGHS
jgi:hypothetical protein